MGSPVSSLQTSDTLLEVEDLRVAFAAGQQVLTATPEYVLIPSIALVITVASLNMLGDALRERWGVQ